MLRIIVFVALCGPAAAQTIVDGSGADLPEPLRKHAIKSLQDVLKDPYSAQIRRLKQGNKPDTVCGEVNAKNLAGGYVGFRAFFADTARPKAYMFDDRQPRRELDVLIFRERGC